MARMRQAVFELLHHLRRRQEVRPELGDALNRIVWFSFPVVYPNPIDWSKASAKHAAIAQRRKRIRRYIREMAEDGDLYLVSLTFGDCLDTTTRKTRDRYAREWLNAQTADYFACLDIGKENGREHYHAIARFDIPLKAERRKRTMYYKPEDEALWWKHGWFSIKRIGEGEKDIIKTVGYAMKASTYAFKSADSDETIKPWHKRLSVAERVIGRTPYSGKTRKGWEELNNTDTELPF